MRNIFYGRFPLVEATALFRFQKNGITQEILHNLKYRGQEKISPFFGEWLGSELQTIESYGDIDMVIPVPIHRQKRRKRGYNQVTGFGMEIAKALEVPFSEKVLLKTSKTNSQVFKKRITRFGTDEIFTVPNADPLRNKHILLVDDIITTGATLESCATQLLKDSGAKISIATIAIA
ncbi:phosphoribosyltransferase family protein [Aureisphaera galaxeae]|uniref:ComF family protein n=1 Tax=Aureisphaera galaxeae TaxID=1538023 RepID=UPI0023505B15|nr:phosphoribosyltransferase family protein [Aureisphaera galaxeae]MDC8002639.1 phosphoribosyltransferase family protein [Aureisphaera galaxeae]